MRVRAIQEVQFKHLKAAPQPFALLRWATHELVTFC
jgi:hypothetical protein